MKKRISIVINRKLLVELNRTARNMKQSRSDFIREALREYLKTSAVASERLSSFRSL